MRDTRLKEMYIVRYADDFRIFCRTTNEANRTMAAVKQWLKQRLRLEVSDEKSRVVNLKENYSDFLSIKMKLKQKKDKLVLQSKVCAKAVKRIKSAAKEKIKEIARPSKGKTITRAVLDYNAFVTGEHNYYQLATDVSLDFANIGYHTNATFKRLKRKLKRKPKTGTINAVTERYGLSEQLHWIRDTPVAPISYVQTCAPMGKKRSVQKYTPEGRKEIHKNLGIDTYMLRFMLRQKLFGRSAEYMDNRLSLFCAQYGKCAVTGRAFELLEDIHCCHKFPKSKGGKDKYQNLIIVHVDVHTLIHATTQLTIEKYIARIRPNKQQLNKINKLRKEAEYPPIIV